MSGPRVTTGAESKQDYQTPGEFMAAVVQRFGPISFDLAAHAGNKQHARYFAPTHFTETLEREAEMSVDERVDVPDGVVISLLKFDKKKRLYIYEKKTRNDDPEAFGKDAFAHCWADLSEKFGSEHPTGRALLWDNCEFNDVPRWAARHLSEMVNGANSLLLTPLTTSNWYRDFMAGKADVYHLSGRLCFDGKNVFPKDCMVSHFHPDTRGDLHLWDWQRDVLVQTWRRP